MDMVQSIPEHREPNEVKPHELSKVPLRLNKPIFNYYRIPEEYKPLVEQYNLSFARCKSCPRFNFCPAIRDEREWYVEHKDILYADVVERLVDEAYIQGYDQIPPHRYKAVLRKAILQEFDRECVLEHESVVSIIRNLKKSYSLDDGKTYLLIRELLVNFLLNFRLDNEFSDKGFILSVPTLSGGEMRVPHAGTKTKQDFSRLFLDYIRQLDEATKQSMSFKIEGEFTMKDMLDRIVDLDNLKNVTPREVEDGRNRGPSI